MKIVRMFFVAAMCVLCFTAEAKEYEIVLEEALVSSSNAGDFPVHVVLKHDGSVFTHAKAYSFYRKGSWVGADADVSALLLSGDDIEGTLQTTIDGVPIEAEISTFKDSNGFIKGSYTGTSDGVSKFGGVEGNVRDPLLLSQENTVSLFLKKAVPPTGSGNMVAITMSVNSGTVSNVSMKNSPMYLSMYNITGPMQIDFIGADGFPASQMGHGADEYSFNVVSHSITLTADSLYGEIDFQVNGGDVYTYSLKGLVVAGYVLGTSDIKDNGGVTVLADREMGGHVAAPQEAVVTSSFAPIQAAPVQSGDVFQPPYFVEISQSDFYNRLQSASFWLGQSAYIGGFRSDVTAGMLQDVNNKQYDNGSENTYGGAMGMLMFSRLTDDPVMRVRALQAAQRAGYWGQFKGTGDYNIIEPYKGLFYTTVGQALTFLELYLATGDLEWRNNAMRYASGLEELQMLMYDSVAAKSALLGGEEMGGTWTYYNPKYPFSDYALGQSDSRDDRSRDWYPIQAGEFLYFLGKLRVEGGIQDYKHVEEQAYTWMLAHIDSEVAWLTKNREGLGPTYFLDYMLQYADEATDDAINTVLSYVETNYTHWEHNSSAFTPGVEFTTSRMQNDFTVNANTSLRMAEIYLNLYNARAEVSYLEKAKAMIYSVLSYQNSFGYIQHGGIIYTDQDAADTSFVARLNQSPSHPYTIYNSETVRLLNECYMMLSDLDEFDGVSINASLDLDVAKGLNPLSVSFDASGSTGTGLTYEWDFGDGTTSTEVSPSHTYTKVGNYIVTLKVTDGIAVVKKQTVVQSSKLQTLERIELRRERPNIDNNPWDKFDTKQYLFINDSIQFIAIAYDQDEILMDTMPEFTWSVTGANQVSSDGMLKAQSDVGDAFVYTLTASAHNGVELISDTAEFCVLGYPDDKYKGFSLNLQQDGSREIDHPDFIAGMVKLNNWNTASSPEEIEITDNTGDKLMNFIAPNTTGVDEHSFPQVNSDVIMSSGRFDFTTNASLIGYNLPREYKEKKYDLYVYSHRSDAAASHSINLQGEKASGYDSTYWLKGRTEVWDGTSYTLSSATTQAEADAGSFSNCAVFRGLSLDSLYIDASYGISGIQVVVHDTFDVFAMFDMTPSEGFYPLTVQFDAAPSLGEVQTYTWDFGDGANASGIYTTHEYLNEGEYEVSLTVSDGVTTHTNTKVLKVMQDTMPLEIESGFVADNQTILLYFNKELDKASAENLSNYSLDNGATINEIVLFPANPMAISISTSTLDLGLDYTVTISNVQDVAPIPNVIPDNSTIVVSNTVPACEINFDEPLSSAWSNIINCSDGSGSVYIDESAEHLVIDASSSSCNTYFDRDYFNGIISTAVAGDFEVYVQAFTPDGGTSGGRGGIILGRNVSPGGAGIASAVMRNFKTEFRYYYDSDSDGLMDAWFSPGSHSNVTWLRMVRSGDTISSYYSNSGPESWTLLGSYPVGFGDQPLQISLASSEQLMYFDNLYLSACPMPSVNDKLAQTITFHEIEDKVTTDAPFNVTAYSSSGLPVSLEIVSGPATIDGNQISLNGIAGHVEVRASQSGDDAYEAATPVLQSFSVSVVTSQFNSIAERFQIFPNPVQDELKIKHSHGIESVLVFSVQGLLLEVYDVQGRNSADLDVSSLPGGVYFLQVNQTNEVSSVTRIVIQK